MQNHIVERIWVELNTRVNYPRKMILQEMTDANEISMENSIHRHCTSWLVVLNLASITTAVSRNFFLQVHITCCWCWLTTTCIFLE